MNSLQALMVLLVLLTPDSSWAEHICEKDQSGVDSLQITEEDLTKVRYEEGSRLLASIKSENYPNYNEITFGILLNNALQSVEGYVLKIKAQKDTDGRLYAKQVFCAWLKDKYWSD